MSLPSLNSHSPLYEYITSFISVIYIRNTGHRHKKSICKLNMLRIELIRNTLHIMVARRNAHKSLTLRKRMVCHVCAENMLETKALLLMLINRLVCKGMYSRNEPSVRRTEAERRLKAIVSYIGEHFPENLSLGDISNEYELFYKGI